MLAPRCLAHDSGVAPTQLAKVHGQRNSSQARCG